MAADAAILATLTAEQAAAHVRAINAAADAQLGEATDETDGLLLAIIDALPAEHGATVAAVAAHMVGFNRAAARAAADAEAAALTGDDALTANAADAWLREPRDADAEQDDNGTDAAAPAASDDGADVDYAALDAASLIRLAEQDGAAFELRDDAEDGISVTGTPGDVTLALAVCLRLTEIRDELHRQAAETAAFVADADATVRDAVETAAAVAAADAIIGHAAAAWRELHAQTDGDAAD